MQLNLGLHFQNTGPHRSPLSRPLAITVAAAIVANNFIRKLTASDGMLRLTAKTIRLIP